MTLITHEKLALEENILAMSYDGPEMEESTRTANPSTSRITDLNVTLSEKHAELLSAAIYDQNWRMRLNGQFAINGKVVAVLLSDH